MKRKIKLKPRLKIARVFPRKTVATPDDEYAFIGPPKDDLPIIDKVHISVTFSGDIVWAECLRKSWSKVADTIVGGPALGSKGGEFRPGIYLKKGYTITSRGCKNKCWFCEAQKRDGILHELKIKDGWNVLDDNLLQCSEKHIRNVFSMLKRQKESVSFTGGLEAKVLKPWHVNLLCDLRIHQMFFAYDTEDDWEPLVEAGKMLQDAGFNRQKLRAYVLIGYPKDTFDNAVTRLIKTIDLGFFPHAMVWMDNKGRRDPVYLKIQRYWVRPAFMNAMLRTSKFWGRDTFSTF